MLVAQINLLVMIIWNLTMKFLEMIGKINNSGEVEEDQLVQETLPDE